VIEVEGESGVTQCMVEVFSDARFTPDKKTIEISVGPRTG